jgi:signal transduction histidine kinase
MKDELLNGVSHQLRTPLNAIIGWAHLLGCGTLTAEETARAISTIDRNARLEAQLIADVVDLCRLVSGQLRLDLQDVEPAFVMEEAIESLRPAVQSKNLRMRKTIDGSVRPVLADAARLRQIVSNILSNAIKFTPAGGKIWVQLTSSPTHARIRVMDTGVGISAKFLPYVFDRFRWNETRPPAHVGLGLSLTIARHLTELHGGQIEAASRGKDRGSMFRVRIPLASLPARSSSPGRARERRDRRSTRS